MDKNSIIKSLKGLDDEKVGFSLKLPVSLKNELQELCEKENISMNGLIVATVQSFINDDCGQRTKEMKQLLLACRDMIRQCAYNLDKEIDQENGPDDKQYDEYSSYMSLLNLIEKTLGI